MRAANSYCVMCNKTLQQKQEEFRLTKQGVNTMKHKITSSILLMVPLFLFGQDTGIVFSGPFGGAVVDGNTYTVPTGSEAWAGFANEDVSIYPFSFPNGGEITFTGATAGTDVVVKYMFQYQPHPNNVPEFETATVTVSGTAETSYSVAIPAQDAANTYSSFLLYVTTLDAAVTLTNVTVTSDPGDDTGIVFSGPFGGAVVDGNTYTVPTGSEAWAGFANEDVSIYPFSFPNGGEITFTGATAGTDVVVKYMFQYQPHPNNVPEFETATVTVSGTAETSYSVAIPAQDAANTYSSFLLYVTTLDAAVTLTNVTVTENAVTSFIFNDFNTLESATDEGDGAFWVEADETESAQNYSTLVQIPVDQAPDSDSPVMSWSWGTDGDLGWGGYTSVYHVYDAAVDISDFNYLSFKFRDLTQPANLDAMSFRVNLFDVSDATTWQTRDDTEVWFSFFEGEANSPFYNVADDGWIEYKIPLVGGTAMGPYNDGFVLTYASWTVGIEGNGVLDLDQIGGLSIEVVQGGTGTNYGEFLLEDIQAIYSADVSGCMDPNACNYDPNATVDDGSCYECVDVTFNLDMSSIPTYTESDTPYLAGGAFFGAPGNEDYALSYNSELSGDGHLVFSKTVQMRENFSFDYTYTSDGNTSWGTKENIVGQDCAVDPWSDRNLVTTTNDTTITACYGTCTDNEFCPAFDLIDVTFAVNMQNEQVDETGVFLHGNWFGWGTMAMLDDDSDGVYDLTIPDMTSGSTIEFKFMNGDIVENVPADCENINDWGGGINRMYTLTETDTTIGPICFGGCVDCAPAGPVDVTFNVDMSGVDGFDGTEAPYVFGSFNNWDSFGGQTMLADEDGDNVYTGTVNDLMSDAEITLLFGYGANYETVPEECGILDSDLGVYVRLLPIQDAGGSDVLVLDAIPYGGCPTGPPVSSVQFTVDVSTVVSTFPEGYQVCVTGEFDGWSGWGAVLTDDDGDMVYTGTRSDLVAGTAYEYKFVINGWDSGIAGGAPLGSGCDFDPSDEFDNYGFTAVEGLLELDEVCWGACVTCDQLSNEENSDNVMPSEFSYKMFPNPFNPYINIYYELPVSEQVTITIMNLLGQEVKTIVNKVHQPGRYSSSWDGKDSYGQVLQSGIYFAVINRQSGRDISKITFLK